MTLPLDKIVEISVRPSGNLVWRKQFDGNEEVAIPGNGSVMEGRRNLRSDKLPQPIRSCTWMFWIRTRQQTGATILSKDIPGGGVHDFFLALNDGYPPAPNKLSWVEGTSSMDFKWRSKADLNDGAWHHVAIVRDFENSTVEFYVDGQPEGPGRNSLMWEIHNDQPFTMGATFRGELRDVKLCLQSLTSEEINRARLGQSPASDWFTMVFGERGPVPVQTERP